MVHWNLFMSDTPHIHRNIRNIKHYKYNKQQEDEV